MHQLPFLYELGTRAVVVVVPDRFSLTILLVKRIGIQHRLWAYIATDVARRLSALLVTGEMLGFLLDGHQSNSC